MLRIGAILVYCVIIVSAMCACRSHLAVAAQVTYFGIDESNLDLTNANAARDEFVATLDAYAEETMEEVAGQADPTLFAGTDFEAATDFNQVFSHFLYSVSRTNALLDQGPENPEGPGFDDWIQFSQPITAFGSYFIQGGDGEANTLTLRLEDTALGTSRDVLVGTLGPSAPFYNIFFFGVSDTEPFDRVTMVETLDYDGLLLDNTIAGFVATTLGLAGDYNDDGVAGAADYVVWRNKFGTSHDLGGNGDETGDSNGTVDDADYDYWKMNFGNTAIGASQSAVTTVVPEPQTIALVMWLIASLAFHRCFQKR